MAATNGVNGVTVPIFEDAAVKPLKVLICGAGIGGLSTAICLRQQGHDVTLFEQSRFANELGAAIHLAPNCTGVLKRMGCDPGAFGSVRGMSVTEFKPDGTLLKNVDFGPTNAMWQHKWYFSHRVDLHDNLKRLATSPEGKGKPAKLLTTSKVVDLDVEAATVTLESGEVFEGDVVIGADGVRSKTRAKVCKGVPTPQPYPSGKSAFRFLIEKKVAREYPDVDKWVDREAEMQMWIGPDRRMVMYPCRNNELLNFVCIHPDSETNASSEEWSTRSTKEELMKVYEGWHPIVHKLFEKSDPESLKLWKLLDMDKLPTWINGRLAVIGDAAHPFLPHQGQGAAQAIEDGVALGVFLGAGTTREEVPERLKLYEECRYDRAHIIQEYTRLSGKDITGDPNAKRVDIFEFTAYNFGHDEFDNATQYLRKWKQKQNPRLYYRMPISFGPFPGPRQNFLGQSHDGSNATFTTASIRFKTSRTLIQNFLPTDSFSFLSPATVAYASLVVNTFDKKPWLSGKGYSFFALYIHGVKYTKSDGSIMKGSYMPVIFENLADPILSGREELGFPKLPSDLYVHNHEDSYQMHALWREALWADFSLKGLKPVDPSNPPQPGPSLAEDGGHFVYKYIPSVDRDALKPDVAYAVYVPLDQDPAVKPKVEKAWVADSAKCEFMDLGWEKLPTLQHIAERLRELPCYEVVEAKVVQGVGVGDVSLARRVEETGS